MTAHRHSVRRRCWRRPRRPGRRRRRRWRPGWGLGRRWGRLGGGWGRLGGGRGQRRGRRRGWPGGRRRRQGTKNQIIQVKGSICVVRVRAVEGLSEGPNAKDGPHRPLWQGRGQGVCGGGRWPCGGVGSVDREAVVSAVTRIDKEGLQGVGQRNVPVQQVDVVINRKRRPGRGSAEIADADVDLSGRRR